MSIVFSLRCVVKRRRRASLLSVITVKLPGDVRVSLILTRRFIDLSHRTACRTTDSISEFT